MSYNPWEKKVFKCDLCEGNPQCVRFCEIKAVDYGKPEKESLPKKREAAFRIFEAGKLGTTLSY